MPPRKRNTVAPPKRRRRGTDPTAAAIRLLDQFSMLDPSEQPYSDPTELPGVQCERHDSRVRRRLVEQRTVRGNCRQSVASRQVLHQLAQHACRRAQLRRVAGGSLWGSEQEDGLRHVPGKAQA